jgi:ADP-heptose:LPS heptosyltransferase
MDLFNMNEFFTQGTLGDAYIICLKLNRLKEKSTVYHKTKHTYWHDEISVIYNLLPDIIINFVENERNDLEELSSSCHEQPMTFFPSFKIDDYYNIKEPYVVIQAHAGKYDGGNTKNITHRSIYKMIKELDPIKVVLVGTKFFYKDITDCMNLVGETSIMEVMSLIKYSSGFTGPEGLLSFFALSHRKDSIILYRSEDAIYRRIIGTPWHKHVIKFIEIPEALC